jgi:GGDEF domain-containing protein
MAPKVFPELRGTILLLNSSRKMLEMAVQWSDCQLPAPVFDPQDCWALRTGHVHVVPAGDLTAPCALTHAGKYAYFCVPLLSQGEAVGILHFHLSQPREPVESELSFSSTFAEQIGLSIANIRLREALRNQSIRDPMTTPYNRRYLEETMERETRRAVRAEDIVCRYGGEEFVVVVPMADIDASHARVERICAKLRELPVLHRGRSVVKVTVSVGVAVLPANGTSPKELLEAADAALYRAKREGPDRVMRAEGPTAVAVAREAGVPGATFAK